MLFDKRFVKAKALFQIFLIVFVVFSISGLKDVDAQEQKVCCSETVAGEHCVYTEVSNCDPSAKSSAATCEQTSFCKLGCGFDQSEGICFNNLPKFSCEDQGNCQWSPEPTCNVPQCTKGCCVLSNQCAFVTQVQCKQVTSQYEDIDMTFEEGVTSELACINQCRSFERGACVHPDASCEFTTRDSCIEENPSTANVTLPIVGFHPDMLCSNPKLGTECASQHHTGCLPDEDEVYWFDSCGNPENIYDSNKVSSYNGGYVLPKSQSCGYGGANINNPGCGNCDYSLGSLCDYTEEGVNPVYGDYACKDLICDVDTVHVDQNTPASLNLPLDNGESWCAYDGLVGASARAGLGLDLAGSRHYRRLCVNGIELTEPCKDFREEICVQGEIDPSVDPALQQIFGTQEGFEIGTGENIIAASCRANRFQNCADMDQKEDCENNAQRDCMWLLGEQEEKPDEMLGVACVPLVSPGLKHWNDESTGVTSKADPKETCEKGSTTCKVYFQKAGLGWFGDGDWEVVAGDECLTADYLVNANSICKSMGDCGAWYNIAGEPTYDGFVENLDEEILTVEEDVDIEGNLPPFGDLQGYGRDYDGEGFFEQFWDEAGWAVSTIAVTTTSAYFLGATGIGVGTWLGAPFSYAGGFFGGAAPVGGGDSVRWFTGGKNALQESFGEAAKGAAKRGAKSAAKTAGQETAGHWGSQLMAGINFLLWLYTIYTILDLLLQDDETIEIKSECRVWQAPVGGEDCELCQEDGKACSEYRCKSLGQNCKLVNSGSKDEKCISANVNDVIPPYITTNKEQIVYLTDSVNSESEITEVSGKGFEIVPKIAPFTAVSLAVDTNEYAQCKYDLNYGVAYDEMIDFFGNSIYSMNHTITFSLPGALAEEEILKLTNGGEYQLYIKCQDGNGNQNEVDYYAKFKIDDGPDFTAPVIEFTSIANGAYVASGINETVFSVYVNEPSDCKWDDVDLAFDDMFNDFTCSTGNLPTSSLYYGLYDCTTTLTGIQDQQDNTYYFRCKDQPGKPENERNVNMEGYEFTLKGTTGLSITSVDPDDDVELKFNSPLLRVITSGGAFGNGDSLCGYNFNDPSPFSAIDFFNTNSSVHDQPFFNITAGEYDIYINCIDIAGNTANETAEFSIIVDTYPPVLTQVYTSTGILNIETDEPSNCEYDTSSSFSFGNGIPMTGTNTEEHTASLEGDIYYIMCSDVFGNIASYTIYL